MFSDSKIQITKKMVRMRKYLTDTFNRLKPEQDTSSKKDGSLKLMQCTYYLYWYGSFSALSYLATMLANTFSYVFVGMKTESDSQAAHGLGYSIGNMLVLTIALGLVNGMDTLCPVSIGVGRREFCWAFLFQALFSIACLIPILCPIIICSEPLLRYLTPNPIVAKLAAQYLIAALPSLFFTSCYEAYRKFLTFHHYLVVHTLISILSIPIQIFFFYVFLFMYENGTVGAGIARSCSWFTITLIATVYVWFLREKFGWSEYLKRKHTNSMNPAIEPGIKQTNQGHTPNFSSVTLSKLDQEPRNELLIISSDTVSNDNYNLSCNSECTTENGKTSTTNHFYLTQSPKISSESTENATFSSKNFQLNTDLEKTSCVSEKNCNLSISLEDSNQNTLNELCYANESYQKDENLPTCNDCGKTANIVDLNKCNCVVAKDQKYLDKNKISASVIIASEKVLNDNNKNIINPTLLRTELPEQENNSNKRKFIVLYSHWWQGIPKFLSIAIPSTFLCAFEWVAFEAQVVGAGYLGEAEQSAIAISASFGALLYIIHLSLGLLTNSEVGRAMSSKCYRNAITFAKAGIVSVLILSIFLMCLVFAFRWKLAQLYSGIYEIQLIVYKNFLCQAIIIVFDAIHVVCSGIIKAQNLQWYGCIIDAICLLGVMEISGFSLAYATSLKGQGFLIGTILGLLCNSSLYFIMLKWFVNWHQRSNMLSN